MRNRSVVIELWPDGVAVTTRAGTRAAKRLERVIARRDPAAGASSDDLNELAKPLDELLAEVGAKDARAIVVRAGAGIATVVSCATTAGAANAERAAQLALANAADFAVDDNPYGAVELLSESASQASNGLDVAPPQVHMLAAAESPESGARLVEWLKARGVSLTQLIPLEAIALSEAVRESTHGPHASDRPRVALWLGPNVSALAAGAGGRLLFVRSIAIGYSTLIDAMRRPLPSPARDDGDGMLTLTHEQAVNVLRSVGLPGAETLIPGCNGLTGSCVLPHLQPIIQRLAVETKQSVKFGIPEAVRPNTVLTVTGPFGTVPNLASSIARSAGVNAAPEAPATERDPAGCVARAASAIRLDVSPIEVRLQRSAGGVRAVLAAGVLVACSLVAFEYFNAASDLNSARSQLAEQKSAAQKNHGKSERIQRLLDVQRASAGLDRRVRTVTGPTAAWPELVASLGHSPEYLRLLAIDIRGDAKNPVATIIGRIRYAEAPDAPAAINRFIAELTELPIVESVKLTSTQRTTSGGMDVQEFELSVAMVRVPAVKSPSLPIAGVQGPATTDHTGAAP